MPFTFSHPAIILPFAKIRSAYISMSCLVAGSMTPDFQYFLQMKLKGKISHTWHGAFLVDLPIALMLIFIFHLIVKRPLIENLPAYFQSRLMDLYELDFIQAFRKNYVGYLVCLQVGILSHIFWDSFTHSNAYFVDHMEFLTWNVEYEGIPDKPLYRYVQHISTVVGAIIIAVFFHFLPVRIVRTHFNWRYWLLVLLFFAVSFLIRWVFGFRFFGDFVVAFISCIFLGFILAGIAYHPSVKRLLSQ